MPPGGNMQRTPRGFLTDEEKSSMPVVNKALLLRILSYLKPYFLLNLSLQSEFKVEIKKYNSSNEDTRFQELTILPYLRLDNLLNTSYESIEDYPMPGISLSLGCKIRTE